MPQQSPSPSVRRIVFEGKNYLLIPTDVQGEVELEVKRPLSEHINDVRESAAVQALQSQLAEKELLLQELGAKMGEMSAAYQEQLSSHTSVVQSLMKTLNTAHKDNENLSSALNLVVQRKHASADDPVVVENEVALPEEDAFFKREKREQLRAVHRTSIKQNVAQEKGTAPRSKPKPTSGRPRKVKSAAETDRNPRSMSQPLRAKRSASNSIQPAAAAKNPDSLARRTLKPCATNSKVSKKAAGGDDVPVRLPLFEEMTHCMEQAISYTPEHQGTRCGGAFHPPWRSSAPYQVRTVDLTENPSEE